MSTLTCRGKVSSINQNCSRCAGAPRMTHCRGYSEYEYGGAPSCPTPEACERGMLKEFGLPEEMYDYKHSSDAERNAQRRYYYPQ